MKRIAKKFISLFFQGFLALLPVILTLYIFVFAFRLIEQNLDNVLYLLPKRIRAIPYSAIVTEALAAGIVFIAIASFGLLVKTILGRAIVKKMDSTFGSIPGINSIYRAIRQIVDLFSAKKGDEITMRPALVEYPSAGIWVIAFVTGQAGPKLMPNVDVPHYTVFIPTTPNPTSGFFCILPREKVKRLDMETDDAVKLVLTGGIIQV